MLLSQAAMMLLWKSCPSIRRVQLGQNRLNLIQIRWRYISFKILGQLEYCLLRRSTTPKVLGCHWRGSPGLMVYNWRKVKKMFSEGLFFSFGWYTICKPMSHKELTTMTHALITNQLDYHNALYLGLSLQTTWKLVQNVAVHLLADIDHQLPTDTSKYWYWPIWLGAHLQDAFSNQNQSVLYVQLRRSMWLGCSP